MNKERLQEIKDSIDFQRKVLIANNMKTLCIDEEQELYDEVVRLNNIINELEKYLKKTDRTIDFNYVVIRVKDVLDKLKELKENK